MGEVAQSNLAAQSQIHERDHGPPEGHGCPAAAHKQDTYTSFDRELYMKDRSHAKIQ